MTYGRKLFRKKLSLLTHFCFLIHFNFFISRMLKRKCTVALKHFWLMPNGFCTTALFTMGVRTYAHVYLRSWIWNSGLDKVIDQVVDLLANAESIFLLIIVVPKHNNFLKSWHTYYLGPNTACAVACSFHLKLFSNWRYIALRFCVMLCFIGDLVEEMMQHVDHFTVYQWWAGCRWIKGTL